MNPYDRPLVSLTTTGFGEDTALALSIFHSNDEYVPARRLTRVFLPFSSPSNSFIGYGFRKFHQFFHPGSIRVPKVIFHRFSVRLRPRGPTENDTNDF